MGVVVVPVLCTGRDAFIRLRTVLTWEWFAPLARRFSYWFSYQFSFSFEFDFG